MMPSKSFLLVMISLAIIASCNVGNFVHVAHAQDYDPLPPHLRAPTVTTTTTTSAIAATKTATSSSTTASGSSCHIPSPKEETLEPTIIASYPGSGAKLTWKLIRAITGYMTSDDAVDLNDLSKQKKVIAIKTHYPARGSHEDLFAPYATVPRSVLLIRNPFNAIPSFHSYIYEQSLHLTGHSVRAPVDKWITWRDSHFEHELGLWVEHTRYWMNHHPFEHRLILPYEYLIKPGSGPIELKKLRTFLENKGQIQMRTDRENLDCIWEYIVVKREDQGTKKGSMREGGPDVWPYTNEQSQQMKGALETLKLEFPGQLGLLMELYIYQIDKAMKAAQSAS